MIGSFCLRASVCRAAVLIVMLATAACMRAVEPAPLDPANAACRFCRMAASDVHFAAQIAAPGAEPVFFDDIGCLRDFLVSEDGRAGVPNGAVAFVADHRTGTWVRVTDAVLTRPKDLSTPMNGGIIAHADHRSRDQDPAARAGEAVTLAAVFGAAAPPKGDRR